MVNLEAGIMIQKIVLYGAGRRCKVLCNALQLAHVEIAAVVDSNPDKWGQLVEGHKIESPDAMKDLSDINICITLADGDAVKAIREEGSGAAEDAPGGRLSPTGWGRDFPSSAGGENTASC